MAIKVLMFGWEFPPHNSGGLGTACLGLTKALSEEGFDITFVLPKDTAKSRDGVKIIAANIDAPWHKRIEVDSPLTGYMTSGKYSRIFDKGHGIYGKNLINEVLRYALIGGSLVTQGDYDIIYAHDWLSFGAGLEAKRISGKPLIVHVHATEFDRCGGASGVNKQVYDLEKIGMEDADGIIAVSEYTKSIIVEQYGIPAEKVVVVHNGIDETTFPTHEADKDRLAAFKADGYKVVLFVGRITLQKGPDYFIRAAKRVLEHNPKVLFLVAGSGDMETQIMQQAAYYKIADRVLFAGFLTGKELAQTYAAADLYVMPSVSEPFGITPLEAMRSGTPILISKQSGVSEVVSHALKVDFWDTEETANKILSIVGYPSLGKTLTQNGRTEVASLTWGLAAHKIKGVIEKVLQWLSKR